MNLHNFINNKKIYTSKQYINNMNILDLNSQMSHNYHKLLLLETTIDRTNQMYFSLAVSCGFARVNLWKKCTIILQYIF